MSKRKEKLDLAIGFLQQEYQRLQQEILEEKGTVKEKIDLKSGIGDAIKTLQFSSENTLFFTDMEIIEVPDGGSDAHFTEFFLVDEGAVATIPEGAIKKDKGAPIRVGCLDFVLKRK